MRPYYLVLLLLTAASAGAQTKLLLRELFSPLGARSTGGAGTGCNVNTHRHVWRVANTTQGSSTTQQAQFAPSTTAPPCFVQTSTAAGGDFLVWISPPLASSVTISANISYSFGGAESHTALNAGFRFVVQRWSSAVGGIVSTIHTSADSAECGTTLALMTIVAAAPTSTSMAAGDRIVIRAEVRNVGGAWGADGSRTVTFGYDGAAAGARDAFANFADTLSFASDTNNARPMIAQLMERLFPMLAMIRGGL